MNGDLERDLKHTLDDSVDTLDELTVARLRAARLKALDALEARPAQGARRWWLVPVACALGVVAINLDLPDRDGPAATAVQADAELLADLDLVLWLEESDGTL